MESVYHVIFADNTSTLTKTTGTFAASVESVTMMFARNVASKMEESRPQFLLATYFAKTSIACICNSLLNPVQSETAETYPVTYAQKLSQITMPDTSGVGVERTATMMCVGPAVSKQEPWILIK